MARVIGIGQQDFEQIRKKHYFYVDKTMFIKEWWERGSSVTLITRPRRFGKTLTMSTLEKFFSIDYAGKGELFEGLSIWREEKYRMLQGSFPVLYWSFADVKETTFIQTRKKICRIIKSIYNKYDFLLEGNYLNEAEKEEFRNVSVEMEDNEASYALKVLCDYLYRYYGKKVILLLDEYDTPMQEAYTNGFWEELTLFIRNLFHATFKNNSCLERAIMTGITRVNKESVFSDLNNLEVVTATSEEYAEAFGFTEEEVFHVLEEYGLSDKKEEIKYWYDGFIFGGKRDIYNPWSIINYLNTGKFKPYWANTSSNYLIGKLIQGGKRGLKQSFEILLKGKSLMVPVEEQIVYNQLDRNVSAVWSLLLASGYLKAVRYQEYNEVPVGKNPEYELMITNREVQIMFQTMVSEWFSPAEDDYNDFMKALLAGDVEGMNVYMNGITRETFSFFDSGQKPSRREPESFYHGFFLGMIVELKDKYVITSNRESGYGRYDVALEPLQEGLNAIIIEFKVYDSRKEKTLEDTARAARKQIEERQYATIFRQKGIPENRIKQYGFAFQGKNVLIST